jgi:hypothetical protein
MKLVKNVSDADPFYSEIVKGAGVELSYLVCLLYVELEELMK